MNLNIHCQNVRMNLALTGLIAQKIHELEDPLKIHAATIILEQDQASPAMTRMHVELHTADARFVAEGVDRDPGSAFLKLMMNFQQQTRRRPSLDQFPIRSSIPTALKRTYPQPAHEHACHT